MNRRMCSRMMGVMFLVVAAVWGAPALAQQMPNNAGYLDDFVVRVKPGKRAAYDALIKKMVAANRQNNGDNWIAAESTYGEGNVLRFTSTRGGYADIEKAQAAFSGALAKALTGPGMAKLFEDADAISESSRTTIRVRRPDLSSGFPPDASEQLKIVGASRWVRLIEIHVRPGMGARIEDELRAVKAAAEKSSPVVASWVSQTAAGDLGTVYYVAQLRKSLGDFDGGQSLAQLLGESRYKEFQKTISEVVTRVDVNIYRYVPELSNPPDAVVAVDPSFWRPKAMGAAKPATEKSAAPAKKSQ